MMTNETALPLNLHIGRDCNGPPCTLCALASTDLALRRHWVSQLGISEEQAQTITPFVGGRTRPAATTASVRQRGQIGGRQQRDGVELVPCKGCKGNVRLKVPAQPAVEPAQVQASSPERAELISRTQAKPSKPSPSTWAVGVTTVPERRSNGLLLSTLASLRAAGFKDDERCSVRLFVDGLKPACDLDFSEAAGFAVTARWPRMRTVGNWLLSALELMIRNPRAERFLMVQDDVSFAQNLRGYLDAVEWPEQGYLNLYTCRANEDLIVGRRGWVRAALCDPSNPALQKGLGALALAFPRDGLAVCLQSFHHFRKIADIGEDHKGSSGGGGPNRWPDGTPRLMGQVRIDGSVVTAMNLAGWSEIVHAPSLVQHLGGFESSMGANGQASARSFPAGGLDALELLS